VLALPVKPDAAIRSGPEPWLIRLDDAASEMHYAAALIETWLRGGLEIGGRRQRVEPGDIAVHYPRRRPDAAVTALSDRLNGFTRAVLPAGDKPTGTLRDQAVKILPMHSARGLQFRIVVLLWADLLPSPFKNRDDGIDRGPTLCRYDAGRGHAGDPAFRQLVLRRGALPRVGNGASVAARRSVRSITRLAVCDLTPHTSGLER